MEINALPGNKNENASPSSSLKYVLSPYRYIEFRYDLGTGPSLIRSLREIKVGQWHRVQAKRWHKDGILKVDQEEDVVGQSQGSLRSLDIGEPTYVGGIPTHSKSQNVSRMAANLGMGPLRGWLPLG